MLLTYNELRELCELCELCELVEAGDSDGESSKEIDE